MVHLKRIANSVTVHVRQGKELKVIPLSLLPIHKLPNSTLIIHPSVEFNLAPTIKILINGRVELQEGCVIQADQNLANGLMLLEDSVIGPEVRVINSNLRRTFLNRGAQAITTNIMIKGSCKSTFLLKVGPGDSYCDDNFAGMRGGVVKRVNLTLRAPLTVRTAQSLISAQELIDRVLLFRENRNRPVNIFRNLDGDHLLIYSQYSHPQSWDALYNPMLVKRIKCTKRYPRFPGNITRLLRKDGKTLFVDLKQIRKKKGEFVLPKHIISRSREVTRLVFKSRRGHFIEVLKELG